MHRLGVVGRGSVATLRPRVLLYGRRRMLYWRRALLYRRRALLPGRRGVLLGRRGLVGFSPVVLRLFFRRLALLRMQQHRGGGQRQAEHSASGNLSRHFHEICSLDGLLWQQSETFRSIVSSRSF
jgi:hypothetical protein